MDNFVTIECRGIIGDLPIGATVVIESYVAGVIRLRLPPSAKAPGIVHTPTLVAPAVASVETSKDK